ncbi:bifunctional 3, partial [Sesbania bispinosa]
MHGDLPELHLILSDSNKTQHLDIEGGAYPFGVANIISPTNSGPIEVTEPNDENEKQEKANAKHKVVC